MFSHVCIIIYGKTRKSSKHWLAFKKKKRKKFLQKYSEWYVILNLTKYHPCSVVELKTEIE